MTRSRHATKKKIRILVADREGVFRLGLKKVLGVEDDLRVVAQAENAVQTVGLAGKFHPDLLFVQAEIAGELRGDLLARVWRASPRSKIMITASALAEDEALRYVKTGAAGVIPKTAEPEVFVKSVRKVMDNKICLPKRQFARMANLQDVVLPRPARPAETLTRREKTIISHLMQGLRNREIAAQLSITEQTVKNHLRMIYDKVGVSDRLELVLYAIHQRLQLPPVNPQASGR